ncbi:MAG: Crp/Fnr family transcriptional regulator [Bacteroidia bacterium]
MKEEIKKSVGKFLPIEEFELTSFKNKDVIYQQGKPSEGLYLISSGKIKISTNGCDKREHISRIAIPGDYIGYESLLNKSVHTVNAVALTDVTIALVPKNIFLYLLESNAEFSKLFAEILSLDNAVKDMKFTDILFKPIRGRLADALLLLERKYKDGNGKITLSRADLANYVGSVRETISRLISEFKEDKLIETSDDFIRIINRDKLISVSNLYR